MVVGLSLPEEGHSPNTGAEKERYGWWVIFWRCFELDEEGGGGSGRHEASAMVDAGLEDIEMRIASYSRHLLRRHNRQMISHGTSPVALCLATSLPLYFFSFHIYSETHPSTFFHYITPTRHYIIDNIYITSLRPESQVFCGRLHGNQSHMGIDAPDSLSAQKSPSSMHRMHCYSFHVMIDSVSSVS